MEARGKACIGIIVCARFGSGGSARRAAVGIFLRVFRSLAWWDPPAVCAWASAPPVSWICYEGGGGGKGGGGGGVGAEPLRSTSQLRYRFLVQTSPPSRWPKRSLPGAASWFVITPSRVRMCLLGLHSRALPGLVRQAAERHCGIVGGKDSLHIGLRRQNDLNYVWPWRWARHAGCE